MVRPLPTPIPILRAPELVDAAVRATLREALAARHLRAGDIDPRTFGNRAIELLREAAESGQRDLDAFALYELETAVLGAASVLLSSKIGRRLLAIDPRRVKIPSAAFDAAVSDRGGSRHLVRFASCASDAARRDLERTLRAELAAPADRSATVHVVSLRDGRVFSQAGTQPLEASA